MQEFLQNIQYFCVFIVVCLILYLLSKVFLIPIKIKYWFMLKYSKHKFVCPKCCCTSASLLRSISIKKCLKCGHESEWKLNEGQLPLVANNRMVKRETPLGGLPKKDPTKCRCEINDNSEDCGCAFGQCLKGNIF